MPIYQGTFLNKDLTIEVKDFGIVYEAHSYNNVNMTYFVSAGIWNYQHKIGALTKISMSNKIINMMIIQPEHYNNHYVDFSELRKASEPFFNEGDIVNIYGYKSLLTNTPKTFYLNNQIYHLVDCYHIHSKQSFKNLILKDQKQIDFIRGFNNE